MTESITPRIDPEFKQRWVTALRNGDYRQDIGALRKVEPTGKDGYCCLGVACDLIDPAGWEISEGSSVYPYNFRDQYSALTPPALLAQAIGLVSRDALILGLYDRNGNTCCLANLNDDGLTFNQIADIIDYFL